ncbi:alpha/beta-hydrolase [Pleomassaria siparia CBS 279.74]|uniref:Alpha/beta-hydrolase n=1 Tax=Pleomassaria siparia CBS 279.74 TaxID=1314801 RepID=A0A6G1KBB7_9PLEO|nr:alpha/beta-hydrolase [Pleomassaria siparia CBS 279.74]
MAFQGFPNYALRITLDDSGLVYTTVHVPPRPAGGSSNSTKPSILFLHGFPSSSYDWHNQIRHFSALGYGVIAPDLLGYGGSSSPPSSSLEPYTFKSMCSDVMAIVKHCGVDVSSGARLHVVGHDFGAILMAPLLGYYPGVALTASFLSTPYMAPGQRQDIELVKPLSEQMLGYEFLGYQRFLMRDDSGRVLDEHRDSFFSLAYASEALTESDFLPPGRLEAWVRADRRAPLPSWATEEYVETRRRIFAEPASYQGPTNWYRSRFRDYLGMDEEKEEIGEGKIKIDCPVLYVSRKEDNALLKMVGMGMSGVAETVVCKELSGSGHWVQLEVSDEVNQALEEFLGEFDEGAETKTSL